MPASYIQWTELFFLRVQGAKIEHYLSTLRYFQNFNVQHIKPLKKSIIILMGMRADLFFNNNEPIFCRTLAESLLNPN